MSQPLVLASFAFVIVAVSFIRLLNEQEFFRLTAMKRVWGRVRGLAIHFVTNVALPLVVGIIFLAQGIAGFEPQATRNPSGDLRLMTLIDYARISAQATLTYSTDHESGVVRYWHWGELTQI